VLASEPAGCGVAQQLRAYTGKANATLEMTSLTWARIVAPEAPHEFDKTPGLYAGLSHCVGGGRRVYPTYPPGVRLG
jgi:hypothetical protein